MTSIQGIGMGHFPTQKNAFLQWLSLRHVHCLACLSILTLYTPHKIENNFFFNSTDQTDDCAQLIYHKHGPTNSQHYIPSVRQLPSAQIKTWNKEFHPMNITIMNIITQIIY